MVEIGQKYGRLTVASQVASRGGKRHFLCACDCGGFRTVRSTFLSSGAVWHCGCVKRSVSIRRGSPFDDRYKVSDSGCHEWIGAKDGGGYGQYTHEGKTVLAHRFAWSERRGALTEGQHVCHSCDNPACVNVDHLFIGNAKANAEDSVTKSRNVYGVNNANAKLSDETVIDMRARHRNGQSIASLARMAGVSTTVAFNVCHRKAWQHVAA